MGNEEKKVRQPDLKRARGRRKDEPPQLFKARKKHYKLPYSTDEAVRKNSPHPAREVRERGA